MSLAIRQPETDIDLPATAWIRSYSPLFAAPGLKSWRRYLRQEYTVFVDESFERFLKMTEVDSRYGCRPEPSTDSAPVGRGSGSIVSIRFA
jgi:hypothetical protein